IPLAPPVRIATRPSRRAILPSLGLSSARSAFATMLVDELGERCQLLLDEAYCLLVLELAGLVVEFLHGAADEDFRLVHRQGIEKDHAATQIILHAATAEKTGGRRYQRDRLIGERLVRHARDPVDGILQSSRDRIIVFRADEDDTVGGAHGFGEFLYRRRKAGRVLDVGVVEREFGPGRRFGNLQFAGAQPGSRFKIMRLNEPLRRLPQMLMTLAMIDLL